MQRNNDASHAIKIFHALSHPLRLSICLALKDEPKSVSQLCELLDTKQYMISQQLSILRKAELVENKRQARQVIYSIASVNIINLINLALDEKSKNLQMQIIANKEKRNAFSEFARIL